MKRAVDEGRKQRDSAAETPATPTKKRAPATRASPTTPAKDKQQEQEVQREPTESELLAARLNCHTESWQGKKPTLEDRYLNSFPLEAINGVLFALYDGHGGTRCADFVLTRLHKNIDAGLVEQQQQARNEEGPVGEEAIRTALTEAFTKTDKDFCRHAHIKSLDDGTTAIVLVFYDTGHKKLLFSANLGDSRAVLCRSGRPLRLSEDHKPDRWDEKRRIERAGGVVVNVGGVWRVSNMNTAELGERKMRAHLATSRTFGDRELKDPPILSSQPEIRVFELSSEDLYVVVACDGVWDVLSDQQVVEVVNNHIGSLSEAASAVNRTSLKKRSDDNLTTTVIEIGWNGGDNARTVLDKLAAPKDKDEPDEFVDMFA